MKKILTLIAAVAIGAIAFAQVNITKVDKVAPTDEIFMDMAVTAAQQAIASGQKAAGAVVILNGAWKATGTRHGRGERHHQKPPHEPCRRQHLHGQPAHHRRPQRNHEGRRGRGVLRQSVI